MLKCFSIYVHVSLVPMQVNNKEGSKENENDIFRSTVLQCLADVFSHLERIFILSHYKNKFVQL